MTKTTKLVWRLGKLPTPEEVSNLVKDKIITNEEAREILFSSEEVEKRDVKSLEAEVKFLRDLVEKLSQNKEQIVKYIETVKPIYIKDNWYQPYYYWCGGIGGSTTVLAGNLSNCTAGNAYNGNTTFTSIQTF